MIRTFKNDDTVTISGNCRVTQKPYSVTVKIAAYDAWCQGELIQNAFPELNAGDREFIKTGITSEGWDKMFGGNS